MHAIAFNWNRWENTLNWIVKTLNAAQFVLMIFDGGKKHKNSNAYRLRFATETDAVKILPFRWNGFHGINTRAICMDKVISFICSYLIAGCDSMQLNCIRTNKTKCYNFISEFRIRWISSGIEWAHLGILQSNFNYSLHCRSCSMFMCIGSFDNKIDKWFKIRIASIGKCFMQQPEWDPTRRLIVGIVE